MKPLRVFVGVDSNEIVAYHVASSSILRRSTRPVTITGLFLPQLPLRRKQEGSTEFSFSRFLVPWLCDFKDQALFVDCDILCRADIFDLFEKFDSKYAVQVVKHHYTPKGTEKFLGSRQRSYLKKNWSSVMLFNNHKCKALTPHVVDTAEGLYLHQFHWLTERQIGPLDPGWNHLVGEYDKNPHAMIAHFTQGTPCFAKYSRCEFADEWHAERDYAASYNRIGEFSLPQKEAA